MRLSFFLYKVLQTASDQRRESLKVDQKIIKCVKISFE